MLWFYKHWTIYLSKQLYFYEYLNDGEFYYKYTFCELFNYYLLFIILIIIIIQKYFYIRENVILTILFLPDLVHYLSQLANIRAAAVGQHTLDDTQSTQSHDAFQSLYCVLR